MEIDKENKQVQSFPFNTSMVSHLPMLWASNTGKYPSWIWDRSFILGVNAVYRFIVLPMKGLDTKMDRDDGRV